MVGAENIDSGFNIALSSQRYIIQHRQEGEMTDTIIRHKRIFSFFYYQCVRA